MVDLYFTRVYYLYVIKLQYYKIMGCGCKNKANNTNTTNNQTPQQQAELTPKRTQYVQETVKDAIKKTVEKYYRK